MQVLERKTKAEEPGQRLRACGSPQCAGSAKASAKAEGRYGENRCSSVQARIKRLDVVEWRGSLCKLTTVRN